MNTLDPRLKHIIKEQLLVALPDGIIDTITRNIERAWLEMPECAGNPREAARDQCGGGDISGDYLEETRLDDFCCPVGPPGEQGVQGIK